MKAEGYRFWRYSFPSL